MRVVIGLGANLGDRLATLEEARARIAHIAGVTLRASSLVYETAPVGGPPQPPFLNAAILVECIIVPDTLLEALMQIELDLGRTPESREVRWGPRTIDLDVLWIDGLVIDDQPRLVVPHPRLTERAFALVPMLDVVPDAVDPRTRALVARPTAGLEPAAVSWSAILSG